MGGVALALIHEDSRLLDGRFVCTNSIRSCSARISRQYSSVEIDFVRCRCEKLSQATARLSGIGMYPFV